MPYGPCCVFFLDFYKNPLSVKIILRLGPYKNRPWFVSTTRVCQPTSDLGRDPDKRQQVPGLVDKICCHRLKVVSRPLSGLALSCLTHGRDHLCRQPARSVGPCKEETTAAPSEGALPRRAWHRQPGSPGLVLPVSCHHRFQTWTRVLEGAAICCHNYRAVVTMTPLPPHQHQ